MAKRGFQLSLNMIIIVILALVFLGVAIKMIYKWLPPVPPTPEPCDIYPPTIDHPVCVNSNYELSRGKTTNIKVAFYNDEDNDIPSTTIPEIICSPDVDGNTLALSTSSSGKDLMIGQAEDYIIIIKVPKDAPRATYPCTLKLSNTQESISFTVK